MHTCRRYLLLIVSLLLLAPRGVQAQETRKDQPLAWLAIHSYSRLEQRLREFSRQAKTPGLADLLLGMLQLQLAGLGGLDRQRPIGVVLPAIDLAQEPEVVVSLPYTEKGALLGTLKGFFPEVAEQAGTLNFRGGPIPMFGRADDGAKVLSLARTQQSLKGVNAVMPTTLFNTQDKGADLVLRADVDAIKKRHPEAWKQLLEVVEKSMRDSRQQLAGDTEPAAVKAFAEAYAAMSERNVRQTLDDLTLGETRVTLAQEGWAWEVEMQVRPGSISAGMINQQLGRTTRAASLFSPGTLGRLSYVFALTESLRQDYTNLLQLGRRAIEAKLEADSSMKPDMRQAVTTGIAAVTRLLEQWLIQPQLEFAAEMQATSTSSVQGSGWLLFPENTRALNEVLDAAAKLPVSTDSPAKFTRNFAQHRDTPLHRLEGTSPEKNNAPHNAFFAAPGDFLTLHVGNTPEPLKGLVDRMRDRDKTSPTPRQDTLVRFEFSPTQLLKAGMVDTEPMKQQNAMGQAVVEKLRQGPDDPLVMEAVARQNAAVMRFVIPGALIQVGAEAMGQQVMQQMKGKTGR